MRTLGQKRAGFALNRVLNIPDNKKKDFQPFSAGAPSMILQNGFGQALAFWISKSKNDTSVQRIMFNIVKDWLSYEDGDINNKFVKKTSKTQEFLEAISNMEQTEYLSAQKETLALLEWVKRYSNAGL